jgi:hypothetical protein
MPCTSAYGPSTAGTHGVWDTDGTHDNGAYESCAYAHWDEDVDWFQACEDVPNTTSDWCSNRVRP